MCIDKNWLKCVRFGLGSLPLRFSPNFSQHTFGDTNITLARQYKSSQIIVSLLRLVKVIFVLYQEKLGKSCNGEDPIPNDSNYLI